MECIDEEMTDKEERLYRLICIIIGCSGVDPDMCRNRPSDCQIIRKIVGSPHDCLIRVNEDENV